MKRLNIKHFCIFIIINLFFLSFIGAQENAPDASGVNAPDAPGVEANDTPDAAVEAPASGGAANDALAADSVQPQAADADTALEPQKKNPKNREPAMGTKTAEHPSVNIEEAASNWGFFIRLGVALVIIVAQALLIWLLWKLFNSFAVKARKCCVSFPFETVKATAS
jgi:hypothetical protein